MCSAGILTIQNVGELCAQRLQQLCIDKKETGGKAVAARKNSTPCTKKGEDGASSPFLCYVLFLLLLYCSQGVQKRMEAILSQHGSGIERDAF